MASFISLSYIVGRWIKDVSPFSPPPESVFHKGAFRDALCPRHMVGSYPFYQLHVPVATHSLLIMPWAAQWEDFQPPVAMRSVISLPISCQRCAMTYTCVEPPLQPLSGEFLSYFTANRDDAVRFDIRARGFWGLQQQSAFFDVWVFNPNASTHRRIHVTDVMNKRSKEAAVEHTLIHPPKDTHVLVV